jgi:cytochrome P450
MPLVSELDLPHLEMEDPAFGEDPWPHFEAARAKHPFLATCKFGIVVSEYRAMKDLLWMDDSMRMALGDIVEMMNARGTWWGKFQEDMILNRHGDEHKRLRDVLAPAFTPRQAIKHRPLMRAQISKLLDQWAPKGAFDFEEFASQFPVSVVTRLIGAPDSLIPTMLEALEVLGQSLNMDPEFVVQLQTAAELMYKTMEELIARRRAGERIGPEEDMLDILIATHDSGGLTIDELLNLLILLFVAGYDTSKNAMTLMMNQLIDRPEDYKRCAEDPAFCAKVVEENFRHTTTANVPRQTARDIEYRGVTIPRDTMLFFPISVAGRDPEVAPDADRFEPEREQKNRHIAFGRGQHMCLGQHIARAQIEEGLHLIAQRLRNPRRAGPSGWRPFFGTWGMRGLPIEFDPA